MKKTYKNPTMEVVKLQAQHLLAGSEKVGFGNGTKSGGEAAGRGFDFDDENEEY